MKRPALLLASLLLSSSALAAPITGSISIFGSVELDVPGQVIEFYPGLSLPAIASGSLAHPWTTLDWTYQYTDIAWTALAGDLFSIFSSDGAVASFNVASYALSTLPAVPFVAIGTGTMSLSGFDPTFGQFSMSSQNGAFGNEYGNWTALTFTPVSVPAPVIGSGLSGLALLLLFLGRRRRVLQ